MPINIESDQSYGILKDKNSRDLFEWINERPYCESCRSKRKDFSLLDKKKHRSYSNLLPGFSSKQFDVPIDILIIAEAHGGGREDDFRSQKDIDFEVRKFAKYYLTNHLRKFHQQQMRILLQKLDEAEKTWVFTDLFKCFVWLGFDRVNNLNGSDNRRVAINYCSKYLEKQINILRPRKILGMGKTVAKFFKLNETEHGREQNIKRNNRLIPYVYSLFPARNTADLWVEKKEWKPVVSKLLRD